MMEQIEIEIAKLKNKKAFARKASKAFGYTPKPTSILNHWMEGLSIPEEKQEQFLELLIAENNQ